MRVSDYCVPIGTPQKIRYKNYIQQVTTWVLSYLSIIRNVNRISGINWVFFFTWTCPRRCRKSLSLVRCSWNPVGWWAIEKEIKQKIQATRWDFFPLIRATCALFFLELWGLRCPTSHPIIMLSLTHEVLLIIYLWCLKIMIKRYFFFILN